MEISVMNLDIATIVQAVLLVILIVTAFLIWPWIKSKTTAQQQENIKEAVLRLVLAAEQLFGAKNGEQKLAHVESELKKLGIKADRNDIESIVYEHLNSDTKE